MSLYRVTAEKLDPVPGTSFEGEGLLERKDIQRWLRRDISPIGDDLMVIAEEYCDWKDSSRRIDLLCLSRGADLVVVEIKRTEDGGHMELQALRYAAMVSGMTLDRLVHAYARVRGMDTDEARSEVLNFLRIDSEDEVALTGEVKIILVSANFSSELATAVLWLNQHDLDIRCVRLQPYKSGNEVLVDVTQFLPIKEAADYEVKMRAVVQDQKKVVGVRQEIFRRFWTQLIERSKSRTQILAGRNTSSDSWLTVGIGRSGFSLVLSLTQTEGYVECHIRLDSEERSKTAFKALSMHKDEINARFGGEMDWQEMPGVKKCSIYAELPGGWKSPEEEWPAIQDRMIDALIRLESALKKPIQELKL